MSMENQLWEISFFVGEEWTGDGIDFCGIEEKTFKLLELELNNMIYAMKATKEAMKL